MKYIITKENIIIAETRNEELAYKYYDFLRNNISTPDIYEILKVKEDSDIINDIDAIRI